MSLGSGSLGSAPLGGRTSSAHAFETEGSSATPITNEESLTTGGQQDLKDLKNSLSAVEKKQEISDENLRTLKLLFEKEMPRIEQEFRLEVEKKTDKTYQIVFMGFIVIILMAATLVGAFIGLLIPSMKGKKDFREKMINENLELKNELLYVKTNYLLLEDQVGDMIKKSPWLE